jgi:hypothetical protein
MKKAITRSLIFLLMLTGACRAADEAPNSKLDFTLNKEFKDVIVDILSNKNDLYAKNGQKLLSSKIRSSRYSLRIDSEGINSVLEIFSIKEIETTVLREKVVLKLEEKISVDFKSMKIETKLAGSNKKYRRYETIVLIYKDKKSTNVDMKAWVMLKSNNTRRWILNAFVRVSLNKFEKALREITGCPNEQDIQ